MPLRHLRCDHNSIVDFSPIQDCPLKEIWFDFKPQRDAGWLRAVQTLEVINNKPVEDFWRTEDPAP
jgi:hypothetical protein